MNRNDPVPKSVAGLQLVSLIGLARFSLGLQRYVCHFALKWTAFAAKQ